MSASTETALCTACRVMHVLTETSSNRKKGVRTMSMTLEEAIIHTEEVADRCAVTDGNRQCEAEHKQLAAWLRELQERRKEPEIIRCAECKHRFTHNCVANVWVSVFGYTVNDDFYCGLAERRTDADD